MVIDLRVIGLAFVLALVGCQTVGQSSKLAPLAELLPGHYAAPYDGKMVFHKIVPIKAPRLGERVLYHQISNGSFDGAPVQQKIYVLKPRDTGMRALVVTRDAELYRNLETKPELSAGLEQELFLQFPTECDFVWTVDAGDYLGQVASVDCQYDSPAFGGIIKPTMTYRLSPSDLAITETLIRANGEPVFPTSHMVGERVPQD